MNDLKIGETPGWREKADDHAAREDVLRRLKIRCWRRGTKEMDLILGGFVDSQGAKLSDEDLAAFDALTREDDASLYRWVSGAEAAPTDHAPMIDRIRAQHGF